MINEKYIEKALNTCNSNLEKFEILIDGLNLKPMNAYYALKYHLKQSIPSNPIERFDALLKIEDIICLLNDGWSPNWEDEREIKYFNYFGMKGGFSYWFTHNCNTFTNVPSALCLKSSETCDFLGQNFLELFAVYYQYKQPVTTSTSTSDLLFIEKLQK